MNMSITDKKSVGVLLFTLVLAALIIYWPDPRMGYVLDDHYVIDRNPVVKNPSVSRVLTSGLFDSARRQTDSHLNYYRPLLTASFVLDDRFFGSNPFAQRMVNIVLHVLNCSLVFALVFLLFKSPERAALAAVLFCILPVHEWSVRYIVGRGDLLSAFFGLSSLTALVLFIQKNSKPWLWLAGLCFLSALLSKEAALLNVGFVFLVVFYGTKDLRRTFMVTAFFGVIAAAYYFWRLEFYPINSGAGLDPAGIINGLGLGIVYALRFWVPSLAMATVPNGEMFALVWAILCFALLFFTLRRRDPGSDEISAFVFGLFWIAFGTCQYIIVQRITGRLGPVLSEHFLYLEAVGFVLILAVMIENVRARSLRKIIFVGFAVYFVSLGIISGRFWRSEEALLRHVQRLEGEGLTVASEQLLMRYDADEHKVLGLISRSPSASTQSVWFRRLGDIYHKRGDYTQAKDALAKAAALNPNNTEALNQWAICDLETGEVISGLELLKRSIMVDPGQSDAYRLSGVYFYRAGQFPNAIAYFKKALEADPGQAESSLHLMMAYYFVNDQNAYLQTIDQMQTMDQSMMLRFAAQEFYSHGFFRETLKLIEQSMRLFQNDPAMMALNDAARRKMESLPK